MARDAQAITLVTSPSARRQLINTTASAAPCATSRRAALRAGRLIDLFVDDETYVFARQLGAETIVVAFNRENKQKQVVIPVEMTLRPLIGDASARVQKGETTLTLPAHTAVALRAF